MARRNRGRRGSTQRPNTDQDAGRYAGPSEPPPQTAVLTPPDRTAPAPQHLTSLHRQDSPPGTGASGPSADSDQSFRPVMGRRGTLGLDPAEPSATNEEYQLLMRRRRAGWPYRPQNSSPGADADEPSVDLGSPATGRRRALWSRIERPEIPYVSNIQPLSTSLDRRRTGLPNRDEPVRVENTPSASNPVNFTALFGALHRSFRNCYIFICQSLQFLWCILPGKYRRDRWLEDLPGYRRGYSYTEPRFTTRVNRYYRGDRRLSLWSTLFGAPRGQVVHLNHRPYRNFDFESPWLFPTARPPTPPPPDLRQLAGDASVLLDRYSRSLPDANTDENNELIHSATAIVSKIRRHHPLLPPKDGSATVNRGEIEDITINAGCIVCYVEVANIVLVPCNHLVLCSSCCDRMGISGKLDVWRKTVPCPMCRTHVVDRIKIFR